MFPETYCTPTCLALCWPIKGYVILKLILNTTSTKRFTLNSKTFIFCISVICQLSTFSFLLKKQFTVTPGVKNFPYGKILTETLLKSQLAHYHGFNLNFLLANFSAIATNASSPSYEKYSFSIDSNPFQPISIDLNRWTIFYYF